MAKDQLTNEELDAIEENLRQAQKLVEEAGDIVSTADGKKNAAALRRLTLFAESIGAEIYDLYYILRPVEGGEE